MRGSDGAYVEGAPPLHSGQGGCAHVRQDASDPSTHCHPGPVFTAPTQARWPPVTAPAHAVVQFTEPSAATYTHIKTRGLRESLQAPWRNTTHVQVGLANTRQLASYPAVVCSPVSTMVAAVARCAPCARAKQLAFAAGQDMGVGSSVAQVPARAETPRTTDHWPPAGHRDIPWPPSAHAPTQLEQSDADEAPGRE